MNIVENKNGNIIILAPEGRLDTTTSGDLEKKILSLIEDGEKQFILDFRNLIYISSNGLRVLLLGAKKLKGEGGAIVLCSMKEQIKEVFDCAGFSSIFKIYSTDTEALEAF